MTDEEILKRIPAIADDAMHTGFAHGGSINKVLAIMITESLLDYHNMVMASRKPLKAPTEAKTAQDATVLVPSNEGAVELPKPRGRPKAA